MIVIVGPYIGSFEQEIITFRPFVRWLHKVLPFEKMYVNTHSNRRFLYKFIEDKHMIPCNLYLSRDEDGQVGYVHEEVSAKDYQYLIRDLKDQISIKENCNKKDLLLYNVGYVKATPPISIYKKIFESINVDSVKNEYKDKIVFIPDNTEKKDNLSKIKDFLKPYDFIVAGDRKTRFRSCNVILSKIDYFENGYKYLIKMITDAKAVICPVGLWTTISNLQQVPVFSWGENVNQHKENGIYYFGNKKSLALASTDVDVVLNMMEHFIKDVYHANL